MKIKACYTFLFLAAVACCCGWQSDAYARENPGKDTLKVGVYDNPPKVFMNSNGQADGIFIDIIRYIEEQENLHIEYIPGEWSQLLSLLYKGEIDVLPDMAYSAEREASYSLNKLPILGSWLEIFTLDQTNIKTLLDLNGKKIGVLQGSIQEGYLHDYISGGYNYQIKIHSFENYAGSVQALKNQEIDAILADRFFYFSALRDEGIFPVGIIIRPTELYFAFTKNHDPDLTERFDKHISLLRNDPGSVYYQSLQKWFDKDVVMFTPRYILWSIVLLVAVLVVVVLFNLLLQTKVKAKTKMLRQLNHDLMLEKVKAEESDRLKTAFLTNMNHEIRTPMNSIMGFAAMLKNHNLPNETRLKYAEIIENSGDRLLSIINNIVEISRIESDTAHVSLAESNINEQLEYVFDLFRSQAKAKNLIFNLSARLPDQWARIVTDRQKIFTILFHLVLNAIKYTKQGSIEFGCIKKDSWLEFFVKDTGIGIPENRQQAIFDRFVQADIEDREAFQGAGLGLSISKAYVEMLGGTIWVESKAGEGSFFYFTIPDQPAV